MQWFVGWAKIAATFVEECLIRRDSFESVFKLYKK